jgi:hypothetical protein
VIEKPLPLDRERHAGAATENNESYPEGEQSEPLFVLESGAEYIIPSDVGHAQSDGPSPASHVGHAPSIGRGCRATMSHVIQNHGNSNLTPESLGWTPNKPPPA